MDSLKGRLLLAGAGIEGAVFRKTVILVAEHDDQGALGFVVNHPSQALALEIAPSLAAFDALDRRLFLGGPVQPEIVAVLAEFEDPHLAARPIFGSVGFAPADAADVPEGIVRAKAFAGYAGWGPGQLESEMEEDSWITEPALADDVFAEDVDGLWTNVVRRKGPKFQLLSTMPFDPSAN
jgi:putative transcriptional regulator